MNRRVKVRTLRRSQLQLMLMVTSLIALIYTAVVFRSYDGGLMQAIVLSFNLEAREFEKRYIEDPETPPPSAPQRPNYLGWNNVPIELQEMFNKHKTTRLEATQVFKNFPRSHKGYEELVRNDAHVYVMYPYPLSDGKVLYMFLDAEVALLTREEGAQISDKLDYTIPLGLGMLLFVLLISHVFNQRVSRETNRLADWAQNLTTETIDNYPPDFRYDELNSIADKLHGSFHRISQMMEREHHFLRNASHELRTPIAVTSASLELMERTGLPDNIHNPVARIKRANHTMRYLTETLLWLSRDQEKQPEAQRVEIGSHIDRQVEDLRYLLEGKPVDVIIEYTEHQAHLQPAALQIVLHNLLRNAFQHTQEGYVKVEAAEGVLMVTNEDAEPLYNSHPDSIGLGLSLVRQICSKQDWLLEIDQLESGFRVRLQLTSNSNRSH